MAKLTKKQIQENINALRKQGATKEERISYFLEQQPMIQYYKKKEKGLVSRGIRGITGLRPQSEKLEELFRSKTPLKTAIAQTTEDVAKIAPFVVSPAIRGGILGKKAIGELLKSTAKLGTVIAGAKAVEEISEGKSADVAAKEAVVTGITGGILGAGLNLTGKSIMAAGKGIAKGFTRVDSNTIEAALKDKSIITKPQKSIYNVGIEIKKTIDQYAKKAKDSYDKGINNLRHQLIEKEVAVNTKPAMQKVKALGIDANDLKRQLKTVMKSEALEKFPKEVEVLVKNKAGEEVPEIIIEDVVDRFINGEKLSFDEAKVINSALFGLKGTMLPEIGAAIKGKIGDVKSVFLKSWNKEAPGIKNLNMDYSKAIIRTQSLNKNIGVDPKDGIPKESNVRSIGKQLLETGLKPGYRNKTKEIINIELLDKNMSSDLIGKIYRSTASENLKNVAERSLLGDVRLFAGAGFGATAGGPLGAMAGLAVTQGLSGPTAAKAAILATRAISPVVKGAKRIAPVSLNRIIYGNDK